jgi:hypothetical protein
MSTQNKNSQNVRRVLTYPKRLDSIAQYKADKIGLPSVQSYIQYLIVKDSEDIVDEVEMLSPDEIKEVGQSLKDFEEGRFDVLRTREERAGYFEKL